MAPASVLLELALSAIVVLGSLWLVIATDPAARLARFRYDRLIRRHAATLIAELEHDRRRIG